MSNLVSRVLSGVVAIPLLAALVLWEQRLGFGLLMLVCSLIGMREFTAMLLPAISKPLRAVVIGAGVGLTCGLYFRPDLALMWFLAALVLGATAVLKAPGAIPEAGDWWCWGFCTSGRWRRRWASCTGCCLKAHAGC